MSDSQSSSGGLGCGSLLAILLTVLFVGLKLTGHIQWDWLWVVSPIWIYAGVVVVAFAVILVVALLVVIVSASVGATR